MKKIVFKRKDKRCFGNRSGFTLVEAITTLVILAIVAAVAIPSLVGYIDSSREKIAVDECSTVVEAANALGVEHVLEVGVVNYDAVVPLADSSEAGESVYSSVTKEAILKRAELEDKGEIKNFSFDPKDSDGYSQPAYLVNEEEVVVSAAADITLAKNIVSPLAVSVEKTTDTDFNETTGISLTYLEYTASNGIDVVYHNGGYQASSKVNVDFKNHNLSATVKQVLTCEQDEIVLFRCSGCDICDGTNNYSVTAVTAFAPGHNYGALTCVGEDKHEQTCTNVLNRLAEGDKALSVGDTLDLEPQYNDLNNLPRVGVECTDKIDGEHFGDITEEVELTEDLERDIPFSLDGVYGESGIVPAGKYTVTTCSGCGYSEYAKTEEPMPDGLVIIDNNNDNKPDNSTVEKDVGEIKLGDPLVFDTVYEAVNYINIANKIDNQTIKLLGNVKEAESIEVKGQHAPTLTIQGVSNSILWDIKGISFSTSTNSTDKLILKSVNISGNNGKNEIIQVSRATIILDSGCTVQGVSNSNSAVRLTGGTLEMRDGSVIRNCSSESGGAISASTNGGIINLYGGTIENCSSAENGGAICVNSKTTLNIKGNPVVVNNTASEKGNNIYLESGKTLNVVGDISGTKTIGIESADKERNQVSGEFGVNNNASYSNGKTIAAFKNDVDDKLYAEVKDGNVIWAEEKTPTWEVDADGYGNWKNEPYASSDTSSEGTIFTVDGIHGSVATSKWLPKGPGYSGDNYKFPQGAHITINNDTNKQIKSFQITFSYQYTGVFEARALGWEEALALKDPRTYYKNTEKELNIDMSRTGGNTATDADFYDFIVNEDGSLTIKTTEEYTRAAKDFGHKDDNTSTNAGKAFEMYVYFTEIPWLDTNYNITIDSIEYVETFATEVELKCKGDASAIKRIGYNTWEVSSCDKNGNIFINDGNIYPNGNNPIVFYLLAGSTDANSSATIRLFGDDPNLSLYEFQIPRRELISNADNEGKIVIEVPAFDFALRIKHSDFDAYNYAKKIRISGAGISKTVDVDDGFNLDTYVTGLIPNKNSSDNITVSILSENDLVIANGEIAQETWKNYSAGNNYEVNVNPTAVVLKLKASITDSSISAKTAEINIKGADVLLDRKYVDISGGSAEILAVPTADRDITVSFKSGGKTIAKKSIEIPYLGEMYNIEITNDDVYTEPDIPEPKPNAVNIRIKFDSKFKDDVNTIIACEKNNPDWQTYGQPYSIDTNENVIVTGDGFVITNFVPQIDYFYGNFVIALKHDTNLIALTEIIPNFMNSLGETIEVDAKPSTNIIKLNIIYRGEDYSRVHCLKVDGAQSPPNWQGVSVSANSNNIGSIYVTINNNSDITISAYEGDIWGTSIAQRTIPWSEIQKHLGDEMNVIIDPVQ